MNVFFFWKKLYLFSCVLKEYILIYYKLRYWLEGRWIIQEPSEQAFLVYETFVATGLSGVNFSRTADKTHAPASFVVQTDGLVRENFDVDPFASSFVFWSATHNACVRTRTSNAVSMLYGMLPARWRNELFCVGFDPFGVEHSNSNVLGPESSFWFPFTYSHCSVLKTRKCYWTDMMVLSYIEWRNVYLPIGRGWPWSKIARILSTRLT